MRPVHDQRQAAECPTSERQVVIGSLLTISGTFHSLFKVLFFFRSHYLFAIGLPRIFSVTRDLPRALGCNPKQPDSTVT